VEIRPRRDADLVACDRRAFLDVATPLEPAVRLYDALGWARLGSVTATFREVEPLDELLYLSPEG
jgi:hypothetical protein